MLLLDHEPRLDDARTRSPKNLGHQKFGGLLLRTCPPLLSTTLALTRLAQSEAQKAPKRDGGHGSPCPALAISTQPKRGTSMIPAIFTLGLATGIALTTAFALGLLPLLLI